MDNWSFAINNDNLIKLVLDGKKKATSSLFSGKEPVIGEESIIHFDNEKDACIIKIVDYKIIKFNEMTEEFALLEGEGDLSLEYWKKIHYDFFKSIKPDFNEEDQIVIEIFEVVKNLVEERLELGKQIANKNLDLFGSVDLIEEINAGYNNTIFNVNDKYVIKVCTKQELENKFEVEHEFYLSNEDNIYIPKLYKYDDSKSDCDYVYEIIEMLEGKTLYYYWYKMNENEREDIIKKVIDIVKQIHLVNAKEYDWAAKIETDVRELIEKCKELFSSEDYEIIIKSLDNYKEILSDNRFAFIHNDLHFDNLIYNNGELKIIDFNDAISAPIDFEFRQLYCCQEKPWKWANTEMDPLQKKEDYKYIWDYIRKYYKELDEIKDLEKRMMIYIIWDNARHLPKYKLQEQIDEIVSNSKKLI